jgi:Na+/H+-dicarboxylate symporter
MRSPRRIAWTAAAAVLLGLVFAAYLQPEVAITLANQLWNCF